MAVTLITADLHITHNENPHRLEFLKYIMSAPVDRIFLLGDVVDKKGGHNAFFVNELVDIFLNCNKEIVWLNGNHDGHDPNVPFFSFLDGLNKIRYVYGTTQKLYGAQFIPFGGSIPSVSGGTGFYHGAVIGSMSESSYIMQEGKKLEDFKNFERVIGGDIHKPQTLGNFTYVGAPYHTRFGDDYTPRYFVTNDDNFQGLIPVYTKYPRKVIISSENDIDNLKKDDEVKLRIKLASEENWHSKLEELSSKIESIGAQVKVSEFITEKLTQEEKIEEKLLTSDELLQNFIKIKKLPNKFYETLKEFDLL